MSELVFLRPWWFAALPLLFIYAVALMLRPVDAGGWQKIIPKNMLKALGHLGYLSAGKSRRFRLVPIFAIAILAIALTGPAMTRSDSPLFAEESSLIVALDMSASVTEGPALDAAKIATARILQSASGKPVGLIGYTNGAYLISAPTTDPSTIETAISVIGPDIMPEKGSRPAAAISLARQIMKGQEQGDLVIISDGDGIDAATLGEAERLRAGGIRLFVVELQQTAKAAPAVDHESLVKLSDGNLVPANDLEPLIEWLSSGRVSKEPAFNATRFKDLGPWIALFAMFPLLLMFWRQT